MPEPTDQASEHALRIAMVSLHTSPLASPGSADAGGMNVVELSWALALAARGHEVELITRADGPDVPHVTDVAPGVRVVALQAGEPRPYAKSAQEELIDPFREALHAHVAATTPPDVIHSQHWFSGVAALPVTREFGIPHVQTYHSVAAPESGSLSDGEAPESPGRRPGERLTARESDLVVAVSDAERRYICERYGLICRDLVVVHPGVDSELFHPLADGERTTDPYLFFAARLQPLKGPDLAIETLAALDPALRPRLVIAGDVSADFAAYRDELVALVHEEGLDDLVEFIGPQSRAELATWLRGSLMLIMPSHSETFGLIALEAAASGVPTVATHAGGLPEAVLDGCTGVLLDNRDPDEWAAVVAELLTDDDLRLELGRAAREHALAHSWDASAARLEEAYRTAQERVR